MAVQSGFFNSVSGDRKYDAEDVNKFFDGILAEGVLSGIGDVFVVSPSAGLQIVVGTGKAWFLKSWITNSSDDFHILSDADLTYDRIDIVALDHDKSDLVRDNTIIIVEGTPSGTPSPPALINTATHLQTALAYILVEANETVIGAEDITNLVGTVDCPFATGLIDQVDITTLLNQWDAEFDIWMAGIEADLEAIDTDAVLAELSDMRDRPIIPKNLLINGDFEVNQRSLTEPETGWQAKNSYSEAADRWLLYGPNMPDGIWTFSRESRPFGRTFKGILTTGEGGVPSDGFMMFGQYVEASVLAHLHKGSVDAKDMILSFDFKSNVTGDYIVEVQDIENGESISALFNVPTSGVWQPVEILIPKETTQEIPISTDAGLHVGVCLAAGTNYTSGGSLQTTWGPITANKRFYGQVNMAQTTGNYFEIADVQLELGPNKTEFERLPVHITDALCRRYREWHTVYYINGLDFPGGSEMLFWGRQYSSRMRIPPVWSYSDVSVIFEGSAVLTGWTEYGTDFNVDKKAYPSFKMTVSGMTLDDGTISAVYFDDLMMDAELTGSLG